MIDANRIKCRFCDFTVMKYRTNKAGETKSGWQNMFDHLAEEHPEEYVKITGEETE